MNANLCGLILGLFGLAVVLIIILVPVTRLDRRRNDDHLAIITALIMLSYCADKLTDNQKQMLRAPLIRMLMRYVNGETLSSKDEALIIEAVAFLCPRLQKQD